MPQYWCHRCRRSFDLDPSAALVCTSCNDDFIELVNRPAVLEAAMPGGFHAVSQIVDIIRNRLAQGEAQQGAQQEQAQQAQQQPTHQNDEEGPRAAAGGNAPENAQSLVQFIDNMFTMEQRGEGPPNVTVSFQIPGGIGIQIQTHRGGQNHDGMPQFVANLNDDREELQTAMQDILAQLNGAEPRNAGFTDSDITEYLPMKKVTKEQIDNGAQCTTCFDTFKLGEDVGALDCNHIFHRPCIEPWLKTKSSCPVCRQNVSMADWKSKHQREVQEAVLEDLD